MQQELKHTESGGIVPLAVIAVFVALLALYPAVKELQTTFAVTETNIALTDTASDLTHASRAIAALTTIDLNGRLTPPAGGPDNTLPAGLDHYAVDQFGRPLFAIHRPTTSHADPLYALVAGGLTPGRNNVRGRLDGEKAGDDKTTIVTVYETALAPHQANPLLPQINEIWRTQCAGAG